MDISFAPEPIEAQLSLREQLVMVANAYAAATNLKLATVSSKVLGRWHILPGLASGANDVSTARFEQAMLWFSSHWPDSAVWPDRVARPVPKPDQAVPAVGEVA